ncbi:hypothetical protein EV421DRAFT_1828507 [Armillaria borealis]|uniref:Uncharacterized protein n=1 Tax=Armillaria borealis TaxID=47425 RepID=A0AA39MK71_9AGAR|nr:hypothetical protein EV421DRAFT_1828507 [Armillaria borealis]
MVHRPADSRLLTNLLSQEKDHSKQLQSLLDSSNVALTSLAAYASACPPPASQVILSVAGSLAGAAEAFRVYAVSIEQWRDYLTGLKDLEDEVAHIMRDREILVTRLIKASKSVTKSSSNRESLLLSPTSSTLSLKSDENPSMSYTSSPTFLSLGANKKLQNAQAELQACEAHLAMKEKELDVKRFGAVRDGLAVRSKALTDCGWRWVEIGKQVDSVLNEGAARSPSEKPLPPSSPDEHPSSDISSIAPSQSASQINIIVTPDSVQHIYYNLDMPSVSSTPTDPEIPLPIQIPPAHAIAETGLPRASSPPPIQKHVLPRRITEEDLGFRTGSLGNPEETNSSDEDEGDVQVVENTRFAASSSKMSIGSGKKRKAHSTPTSPTRSSGGGGSGFFGSIKGLGERAWCGGRRKTRDKSMGYTNREEHQKLDVHESYSRSPIPPLPATPSTPSTPTPRPRAASDTVGSRRLRKGRGSARNQGDLSEAELKKRRRSTSLDRGIVDLSIGRAEEWVDGQRETETEDKGWASDTATAPRKTHPTVKRKKSNRKSMPNGTVKRPAEISTDTMHTGTGSAAMSPNLSRNSSLMSASSAPARLRATSPSTIPPVPKAPERASSVIVHKKRASVDDGSGTGPVRKTSTTKSERRASSPVHVTAAGMGEGSVSLMSIVEDVARANREGWAASDKRLSVGGSVKPAALVDIKAPTSPTVKELRRMDAENATLPTSRGRKEAAIMIPTAPKSVFDESGSGFDPNKMVQHSAPVVVAPKPRPALSPLRSALKSPSRTPSPMPGLSTPTARPPSPPPAVASPPPTTVNGKMNGYDDDAASISSYETGHEVFEVDDPSPPLPPKDPAYVNHIHVGSDLSASSNASTETPGPRRRKSVRVALQPTFSTTPPAIDYDDEALWARANGEGWKSNMDEERDMWADSSDEDVEYQRAKTLLNRAARREKKSRGE